MNELSSDASAGVRRKIDGLSDRQKLDLANEYLAKAGVIVDSIVNGGDGPIVLMEGWDRHQGSRIHVVRVQRNVMKLFLDKSENRNA
jgi:hypothetical protein